MTVTFSVTIEGPNITTKKNALLYLTHMLLENLLLIVPYDIYEITLIFMLDFPQKSLVNYKRQVKTYLALNINRC